MSVLAVDVGGTHDPMLEVADRFARVTSVYQGLRRMTLTYPALDRARREAEP